MAYTQEHKNNRNTTISQPQQKQKVKTAMPCPPCVALWDMKQKKARTTHGRRPAGGLSVFGR